MGYKVSDSKYDVPGGVAKAPFSLFGTIRYMLGRRGPSGFGSSSTAAQVAADWDGKGKVVIITGASAGLGLEATRVLVKQGAHVVAAVRDMEKATQRANAIRKEVADAKLTLLKLDLMSMQSVKSFVEEFRALGLPLHVLMLNAGIMATPYRQTTDGYESQFQTNHLSQFLLAQLLTPDLITTATATTTNNNNSSSNSAVGNPTSGRVVVLSSAAQFMAPTHKGLPFETFTSDVMYSPWETYGRTKLCNVLFTREYNVQYKNQAVQAVCCHPGGILTELTRDLPAWQKVGMPLVRPFLKSVAQGAATQTYLATTPNLNPGAYYADCNVQPSCVLGMDADLGAKLWEWSVQHTEKHV